MVAIEAGSAQCCESILYDQMGEYSNMRRLVTICTLWYDSIPSMLSGSDVGLYSYSDTTPVSQNTVLNHTK